MTTASAVLPKISVITPSYNQANFIQYTIDSVLAQGYPNLEYIIMDGGSTDGTIEILKKYQDRFQWISQKDGGQSDAINKGFQRASGDILAFLNSDDCYEPGALNVVGRFFRDHPEAHWITGKCRIVNDRGKEIRKIITAYKNFWLCLHRYQALLVLDYISQPATFWRRDVIERVGLFDINEHYSMDYDFSLRAGRNFKLWFINTYLAAFRVQSGSKSRQFHKHFANDLETAKRYTNSKILRNLHRLHNSLIVGVYEHIPVKKTNDQKEKGL